MKERIVTCWHVDLLRAHVENRCRGCHAGDCFPCHQAAGLAVTRRDPPCGGPQSMTSFAADEAGGSDDTRSAPASERR